MMINHRTNCEMHMPMRGGLINQNIGGLAECVQPESLTPSTLRKCSLGVLGIRGKCWQALKGQTFQRDYLPAHCVHCWANAIRGRLPIERVNGVRIMNGSSANFRSFYTHTHTHTVNLIIISELFCAAGRSSKTNGFQSPL